MVEVSDSTSERWIEGIYPFMGEATVHQIVAEAKFLGAKVTVTPIDLDEEEV